MTTHMWENSFLVDRIRGVVESMSYVLLVAGPRRVLVVFMKAYDYRDRFSETHRDSCRLSVLLLTIIKFCSISI